MSDSRYALSVFRPDKIRDRLWLNQLFKVILGIPSPILRHILSHLYFYLWIVIYLLFAQSCFAQNLGDTIRTVKINAAVDLQNQKITINWIDDPGFNSYQLFKKNPQDSTWGPALTSTINQDGTYEDTDVQMGALYEYRVTKETGDSLGYGYLYSGLDYVPLAEKGKVLIIIESNAHEFVNEVLNRYVNILTSEGWIPNVVVVSNTTSVTQIKEIILERYDEACDLKSVILMGDIAVPHSGNIKPDGHLDHQGAWPADLYYGDVDGIWTDVSVDNSTSIYNTIHNIPGDGNFDEDVIPSDIEIAVGRLDFSELPVFEQDQYELLKRYLQKNIDFRTAKYRPRRRAVFRNVNIWDEGLGQNAIRNFYPLVQEDSIIYFDLPDAFNNSYLLSYEGASGSMTSSTGSGNINTYASNNFQASFTAYFGSYYGNYDYENNFLRTVLASGTVLSTAWVGAPNWYFHPMGMGLDLGHCTLLSQNNLDVYYAGYFPRAVTVNLLGDPTLTLYPVSPPTALTATSIENDVNLEWMPSLDLDILGYNIYRKYQDANYFEKINNLPMMDTNFTDHCVEGMSTVQYLVKTIKREITPSGTFINSSTGPIISLTTEDNILPTANFELSYEDDTLSTQNISSAATDYEWILPNDTTIFTENFSIPFMDNDSIMVILIAKNACHADTLEQTLVSTSTSTSEISDPISIYPIPSTGLLNIKTTAIIQEIHVYDNLGICIYAENNTNTNNHSIMINVQEAGLYFLKIRTEYGLISKQLFIEQPR